MKKFLFFIAAAIVAAGCVTQSTTDKPELRFREDGTFKIAQFTTDQEFVQRQLTCKDGLDKDILDKCF